MEAPRLERKLVAILAADVEGYSRHMERDEAATLATLSSHRVLVDELIASHGGRITGTAGDSVLAEFASVVNALDCAVKIQEALAGANAGLPTDDRLLFRIGINVGDVMVKDGDIFGDGVNIAARLESLAEAGGICISRGVRDHVRKMGRYAFEDLGEQSVKNITQPIRAFRVRGSAAARGARQQEGPDDATQVAAVPVDQPGVSLAPQPVPQPAVEPAEFELTFWESIKDSTDPAEFAAYLEQYPEGTFKALAEARRQSLEHPAETTAADDGDVSEVEPQPAVDPAEFELTFWESIKDSTDPAEFAAYLEQYPEGAFKALAEARRQALEQPAEAASAADDGDVSAVELAYWDTVKDSANPDMYAAYLERYPDGAFAALARLRLEELGSPAP